MALGNPLPPLEFSPLVHQNILATYIYKQKFKHDTTTLTIPIPYVSPIVNENDIILHFIKLTELQCFISQTSANMKEHMAHRRVPFELKFFITGLDDHYWSMHPINQESGKIKFCVHHVILDT